MQIHHEDTRLFIRRGKSVALRSHRDAMQAAQSARATREYRMHVDTDDAAIEGANRDFKVGASADAVETTRPQRSVVVLRAGLLHRSRLRPL